MAKIRWLSVVVGAAVAFGLSQPAGATTTTVQIITERGRSAQAVFSSTNGCIHTHVRVDAGRSTILGIQIPEGAHPFGVDVEITRTNSCTHTTLPKLAGGIVNTPLDVLVVTATAVHVKGTLPVFDYSTNTASIFAVDVSWTATGPFHVTHFHSYGGSGSTTVVVNASDAVRPATATGTVTHGSTTFASGTAASGTIARGRSRTVLTTHS